MTRRPEDDPLGSRPTLPVPNPAAVRRAQPLFARLLQERGAGSVEPVRRAADLARGLDASPPADPVEAAPPRRPGALRRYDATLRYIAAAVGSSRDAVDSDLMDSSDIEPSLDDELALASEHASDVELTDDDLLELEEAHVEPLHEDVEQSAARPPPFAPTIRPSPPPRRGRAAIDEGALASLADAGMLISEPDGSASFEIAFNDEVFSELACRISFKDGGVTATFRAPDANTRRLLEAEAGRLRVQLEERGIKVRDIAVELAQATDDAQRGR